MVQQPQEQHMQWQATTCARRKTARQPLLNMMGQRSKASMAGGMESWGLSLLGSSSSTPSTSSSASRGHSSIQRLPGRGRDTAATTRRPCPGRRSGRRRSGSSSLTARGSSSRSSSNSSRGGPRGPRGWSGWRGRTWTLGSLTQQMLGPPASRSSGGAGGAALAAPAAARGPRAAAAAAPPAREGLGPTGRPSGRGARSWGVTTPRMF